MTETAAAVHALTSETMFVRLHECNDHEGESWDWWLQRTGNERELDKLAELVPDDEDEYGEPGYSLHLGDVEPESVVDKLVQYAGEGYYAAHNKVTGTFTCPDDLGEDLERLYKGGVRDLFAKDATS